MKEIGKEQRNIVENLFGKLILKAKTSLEDKETDLN